MMNTKSADNFIDQYLGWLKENIDQCKVNDTTYRMTLPFMDRNNDFIDIYIIAKDNGSYLITDDGATLNDLLLSGFEFNSGTRRKNILDSIITAYGITRTESNELVTNCSSSDLPLKKHLLAKCMVKVSDLFYLSRNSIQSIFLEDVQNFLDAQYIRYIRNFDYVGRSKLSTHYDFAIPKSRSSAERYIKVVNNLDNNAARNIIFAWDDTKDLFQPNARLYTFIQDTDKKVSNDAISALREYNIIPALWSKKESYIEELSA